MIKGPESDLRALDGGASLVLRPVGTDGACVCDAWGVDV